MARVQTKAEIQKLKDQYVEYYVDLPVQKYAAMHIARDEDTIIRWRHEDQTLRMLYREHTPNGSAKKH